MVLDLPDERSNVVTMCVALGLNEEFIQADDYTVRDGGAF